MRRIRPEEAMLALLGVALVALMAATSVWRFTAFNHPRFLQVFAGLAACVFVRAALRERSLASGVSPGLRTIRDFLPFFLALVLYETLHDLTPEIRPDVVDGALIKIDRAVFGVDVSQWLGRLASPLFTHVMVDCYLSYFFAPVLLAAYLYWRDQRVPFREYMVSLTLVTLLGYVGYLIVPAVGPYVYQSELFPTRLPGGEKTHFFIAQIDSLKGVARDCFPSMHTAHTTVVLAFAWKHARKVFFGYLPIGVGLYFSTVYLRMHYVVDVAAGFLVAALAVWYGPRLERAWNAKASPELPPR
jgi:membrane-associated phospholipid phosphatase